MSSGSYHLMEVLEMKTSGRRKEMKDQASRSVSHWDRALDQRIDEHRAEVCLYTSYCLTELSS